MKTPSINHVWIQRLAEAGYQRIWLNLGEAASLLGTAFLQPEVDLYALKRGRLGTINGVPLYGSRAVPPGAAMVYRAGRSTLLVEGDVLREEE